MWGILLLSYLLLRVTSDEIPAPPSYMVVVPAVMFYPSSEKLCVHISEPSKFILVVYLKALGRENTLLAKRMPRQGPFECVNFQVPPPTGGSEEVVNIKVSLKLAGRQYITEKKKVLIKAAGKGTFVQTDKPMYKPGQTVKFRIVTFDKFFLPSNEKYPVVELQDPKGNRIGQWLNAAPRQGILDLSHPLSSEPLYGIYTIIIKSPQASQTFEVQEYVLPKFEVEIGLPLVLTSQDQTVHMSVCGRYTYGKPVKGTVHVTLCRRRHIYRPEDLCKNYESKTDSNGCFKADIDTHHFQLFSGAYNTGLEAKARLIEDGTGVEINASRRCPISSVLARVTFEDMDPHYKPGMLYRGMMKLAGPEGSPWPNQKLTISVNDQQIEETYTTDQSGRTTFALNTSSWGGISVFMKGRYWVPWNETNVGSYQDAEKSVMRFWTDGATYVSIRAPNGPLPCGLETMVTVDFTFDLNDMEEKTSHLYFNYLVTAKGGIVLYGQKEQKVSKTTLAGSFSITLPVNSDLAPSAKVLIYTVLPNKRITADTTELAIANCFKNEVTLGFSEQETLPGSDVKLKVQAAPGSLCSIWAVDKSVLLLKPQSELSSSSVYGLLSFLNQDGYPRRVDENDRPCNPRRTARSDPLGDPVIEPRLWLHPGSRSRRSSWQYPHHETQPDTFSLFKSAGLKLWTNLNVKQPQDCIMKYITEYMWHLPLPDLATEYHFPLLLDIDLKFMDPVVIDDGLGPDEHDPKQKDRTDFPETWLWDLQSTGPSGKKDIMVTTPDTITEWKANTFCMADIGFGLSQMATLKTFKPFFVELTMPYSVVRGEGFTLKATVFNYLKHCIAVQVTLAKSQDFEVEPCMNCLFSSCLCVNEVKTFTWDIKPETLGEINITVSTEALRDSKICGNYSSTVPERGRKDTLRKVLLVRAEGVLEEKTHSSFLCNAASEKISLELPADVVKDSGRAFVSAIGDIMGTAMNNVDKLLAMPYGCGEQNMVKFAPNVCIWHYLEKTGQMTKEIKVKTEEFLKRGYQRQLNYKHRDGSYSAFGNSDPSGNTWLTAFVAKCFGQAKQYIFIDENHTGDAVKWLKKNQLESGCFRSMGKLLNNALKGGVSNEVSLSAYITIALLELGMPRDNRIVEKALQCLENAVLTNAALYTKALMAVAFALAGNEEKREQLLQELDKNAIKSDGQLYWTETPQETRKETFWSKPRSVDVEMTAYVLLAFVSGKNVSNADQKTATSIVKWLTKQQNSNGGFASTQDTMVALQALSRYAEHTYSPDGKMTVSVTSSKGFQHGFTVESRNRLLLQQQTLPEIPGVYTASSVGQGCVYVQTTLRYNVPPPKSVEAFNLEVWTTPKNCMEASHKRFTIHLRVSYTGNRVSTNMVLIEVKMISGFSADKETVKALNKFPLVKKTEILDFSMVTVYLDELNQQSQEYFFSLEQEQQVSSLQPATVKAYDYYEKGDEAIVEYTAPCH